VSGKASKGAVPYPDVAQLEVWYHAGIDPDVVRAVVMDRIKWKPLASLVVLDKPVCDRWAQVQQTRGRAAAAPPPAKKGPTVLTDEQWTVLVKMYHQHGAWGHNGPTPDCVGCEAPVDILASYGYGQGEEAVMACEATPVVIVLVHQRFCNSVVV
jgi:hypothetical protein